MSDEMIIGAEQEESNPLPLLLQAKYGISTLVGTEILCAHFGPTGIVAGIVAGWLASQCGPEIHASVQRKYAKLDPKSKAAIHAAYCRIQEMRGISLPDDPILPEEEDATDTHDEPTLLTEAQHEAVSERIVEDGIFPEYAEYKRFPLGRVAATGQRFDPSSDDFLGYGAILAGSQGSGKSVAVAGIAEHLGEREMSEILFDMKREYFSILGVVANGIIAGHPDARDSQDFRTLPFYPLTLENAGQFAAEVMEKGYQAVVDIPSFLEYSGNDWNVVIQIITAVLNGLMRWSIGQKNDQDRMPCLVAFDEAHIFFPQNAEMKGLFDTRLLSELNAAAFSAVNMGRSYGYTMLFSTQRIANIAKWTIGNCQIKVIMRHSVDVDLERCKNEIGKDEDGHWYATEKDIKTLPAKKGYGYVLGFTEEPYLIQFDMRRSYHPSNTPTMERVQQRKAKSAQPVQQLPDLLAEEEESGVSMHDLCEAVLEMADKRYKADEIIHLFELTEQEYREVVAYIRSHRSEFKTAQAASVSSFDNRPKLQVVPKLDETASNVGLKGSSRGVAPSDGKSELSEREVEIGRLYFGPEQLNPNAIVKKLWPTINGGDAYQKKSVEVNAAIRKYVAMQEGA